MLLLVVINFHSADAVSESRTLNPFSMKMKYLIVKGWLGFGDRLESLKMAVAYALKHNVKIYVDWRDQMWSHGSEDFYTYFKLVNMPVLNSLDEIPEDATYHPPHWKGRLNEHMSYEYFAANKTAGIDIGVLDAPFSADVVVFSSCGWRTLYPDSSFFANVFRVIDQRVIQKIRHHKSSYAIDNSWGIHIRGGDHIHARKRIISIQSIVSHIVTLGGMNRSNIVAVSDDKEQLDIWKRFFPSTYVISQVKVDSAKGVHNLTNSELGMSKDQLNVDMLVDFFILSSCERIYTTVKGSRFSTEAQRLHPFVKTILSF